MGVIKRVVTVTQIAEQWWCEKAVDLQDRHPRVTFASPEIDQGTLAHEALASDAVIVSKEELVGRMASGRTLALKETLFEGTYKGILIRGIPDYVETKGDKALFLADFKFSKRRKVYASHRIQVDTYGFLLHKNRLQTKDLICGIAVINLALPAPFDRRGGPLSRIKKMQIEMREYGNPRTFINEPAIYGQLYPFSLSTAKRNLAWASEYWLKKRRAIPTQKASKCKVCMFGLMGMCDKARISLPERRLRSSGSGRNRLVSEDEMRVGVWLRPGGSKRGLIDPPKQR